VWAQGAEVRRLLPAASAAGQGRLVYWGFEVYHASLWVTPGFRQSDFADHAFALELDYLRDFSAADIARRSIDEMARAASFDAAQARRWQSALQAALRDVRRGDRVTGVNRPGAGVAFLFNGKPMGEVADAQFARLFFAIWLGERTSEPGLRRALLAGTPP
jgi:hypothetical protein